MDQIKQMLDRIGELSDAELDDLESQALSEFDTAEASDVTPQSVDAMSQLADAIDAVRGEKERRTTQAAELSKAADEIKARVKGSEPAEETAEEETPVAEEETEPVEAVAASAEATEAPAEAAADEQPGEPAADAPATPDAQPAEATATAEGDTATATAVAPAAEAPAEDADKTGEDKSEEAVTASANTEVEDPQVEAPADRKPVVRAKASVAITAGADIAGVSAGSPLDNMQAVAKAMTSRMHQMHRTNGGDGEQHTVAIIATAYPEDRTLRTNDPEGNASKVEKVLAPEAITAAGGICAPIDVNRDIFEIGDRGRPVKDALGVFGADRGGIRFLTPPTLADVTGAVSLWTLQDDIDAATPGAPDPVKPCVRVDCGEEITVYTDAIPLCLTFGNLNARAYPELVARHNELALIQHDRFAETRLLTRMGQLSTPVTAASRVSAALDFFSTIDKALAAYRSRHRLNNTAPMRLMLPNWFQDLLRSDLTYRMPGDGIENNIAASDALINRFFSARAVNVSWFMDGETGQVYGPQLAGEVVDWPDTVVWYMFAEGTFLFLDGGTLDLGLVRDSTLNGTNDYKMFVETFEGVAKVGLESLRVEQSVKVTGMVAGTLDTRTDVIA